MLARHSFATSLANPLVGGPLLNLGAVAEPVANALRHIGFRSGETGQVELFVPAVDADDFYVHNPYPFHRVSRCREFVNRLEYVSAMVLMAYRRAEERGRGLFDPVERARENNNAALAVEWERGVLEVETLRRIFEVRDWVLHAPSGAFVGWHPYSSSGPRLEEASPQEAVYPCVVHPLQDGPDAVLGLGVLGSMMVYWRLDDQFDWQNADTIYATNTLAPEKARPSILPLIHEIFDQYGSRELSGGLLLIDSNGLSHEIGGPDWNLPEPTVVEGGFRILSGVGATGEIIRQRDFPHLAQPLGPLEVCYGGGILWQRFFRPADRSLNPTDGVWDLLRKAFPAPGVEALPTKGQT